MQGPELHFEFGSLNGHIRKLFLGPFEYARFKAARIRASVPPAEAGT